MTDEAPARLRRLIGELVEYAPPAPPFPTPETVAVPRRPRARVLIAAAVVVVLVGVIIGVAALAGGGKKPTKPVVSVPAPAPLGAAIAYVTPDGLFAALPGASHPTQLSSSNDVTKPRWSPDGEYIAYESGGGLFVGRTDGTRTRIEDAPQRWAWGPGGHRIALLRKPERGIPVAELVVYDVDGLIPTAAQRWTGIDDFAWQPDGSLYVSKAVERGTANVRDVVIPAHGGVEANPVDALPLHFQAPDSQYGLVLGTTAANADLVLWEDPSYGSSSSLMDAAPLNVLHNREARPIGSMFVQRSWATFNVYDRLAFVNTDDRMVTGHRTLEVCDQAWQCHVVLADGSQTMEPAWSPDGTKLAFVRDTASNDPNAYLTHDSREIDWRPHYAPRRLWIANEDGTGAHEITTAGTGVGVPTWVSNNDLVFTRADGTVARIDLGRGQVTAIGRLAQRGTMPPAQVYDPTDANGELQWTDLFAVAPQAP